MKTRMAVMLLLLLSIIVTACGTPAANVPADPVEAVKVIADKQSDIKTEHIDVTLDLALKLGGFNVEDAQAQQILAFLKNFKANVTLTGDVDIAKNDTALQGTADLGVLNMLLGGDKAEFQLVKVGDKLYSKLAGQDWNETDAKQPSASDNSQQGQFDAQQLTQLLKKTAKAEKLNDEAIDGADSFHYKVTLNTVDLITEMAKMSESAGGTGITQDELDQVQKYLKDSIVEVEIWVGKQDLFIRQEKIHFNLNLKDIPDQPGATANVDFLVAAKLSKLNQPVTITAPK